MLATTNATSSTRVSTAHRSTTFSRRQRAQKSLFTKPYTRSQAKLLKTSFFCLKSFALLKCFFSGSNVLSLAQNFFLSAQNLFLSAQILFLWPKFFETSPHVIDRIVEAIEGIRQPYWRIYNDAYVQSADAMVPAYPAFEEENTRRHELDIFI
jgi:hypothetical protein